MPRLPLVLTIMAATPFAAQTSDAAIDARARVIHDRVLTLDTHVDINPSNFQVGAANSAEELSGRQQVDIPTMERGGLDAAFLIVYVGQSTNLTPEGVAHANAQAVKKFAQIGKIWSGNLLRVMEAVEQAAVR